jgi:predicted O-methyltransferase YrrM
MSDVIDNPELYFRKLLPPRDPLLIELEQQAAQEDIPIVGPLVGELLYILVAATRSEHVLELGTATGYSAIHMARALRSPGARLVTLENDPFMAARAQSNINRADLADKVEIVTADARKHLATMAGRFDFAFLDIEKEFYVDVLPYCQRLIKPGGLLVADNVAFRDAGPFNSAVFASEGWRTASLFGFLPFHSPEFDGICLALRI